ncbi:MAG: preprotein translocase subunit SecE [Anaerolineales bacterium]
MADKKSNKLATTNEKETSKPVARSDKKVKENKQPNAIVRFVRETVGELRKVNWPTWPEARNLTGVVLLVLFVMSIFLGLVDAGAAYIIQVLMGIR